MNDEIERSRDGKKPEACLIMDFPILLNVFTLARCLKITEKVAFNIASEAS